MQMNCCRKFRAGGFLSSSIGAQEMQVHATSTWKRSTRFVRRAAPEENRTCTKQDEFSALTAAGSRRQLVAGLFAAAAVSQCVVPPLPARAEASSSGSSSSAAEVSKLEDSDFRVFVPSNFQLIDMEAPVTRERRVGPMPERSPVRLRVESPDKAASVTVILRDAKALKLTLQQVSDISQLGGVADVAALLLPRGSALVASASVQVAQPPRAALMGEVTPPPQTYYRYEFTAPNGTHAVISAAAQKGKVYVCGGSAADDQGWANYKDGLVKAVTSFQLKFALGG